MSGMPSKEQMNAAAARAGGEAVNLGASLGENVQKLQWWINAKVVSMLALRYIRTSGLRQPQCCTTYFPHCKAIWRM